MAGRLQALVGTREQLLRTIAHELRSPLARLQLAVELARRKDERLDLQLDRIEREGERLDALVGNTLALAKMGALPEPANMLDLAEVVDAVVEDARFEAGDRNVGIAWERPAPCASRATARAWPARSRTCCAMRCASRRRAAASACVCWRACATCSGNRGSRRACRSRSWAICSSPSTAAPRARPWRQRRRPGPEHRAAAVAAHKGHLGQQCAASGIERAHRAAAGRDLKRPAGETSGPAGGPSAGPRLRSGQSVIFADTHKRRPSST